MSHSFKIEVRGILTDLPIRTAFSFFCFTSFRTIEGESPVALAASTYVNAIFSTVVVAIVNFLSFIHLVLYGTRCRTVLKLLPVKRSLYKQTPLVRTFALFPLARVAGAKIENREPDGRVITGHSLEATYSPFALYWSAGKRHEAPHLGFANLKDDREAVDFVKQYGPLQSSLDSHAVTIPLEEFWRFQKEFQRTLRLLEHPGKLDAIEGFLRENPGAAYRLSPLASRGQTELLKAKSRKALDARQGMAFFSPRHLTDKEAAELKAKDAQGGIFGAPERSPMLNWPPLKDVRVPPDKVTEDAVTAVRRLSRELREIEGRRLLSEVFRKYLENVRPCVLWEAKGLKKVPRMELPCHSLLQAMYFMLLIDIDRKWG